MQTQPVENLDAVLGRFQAWAGSRGAMAQTRGVRELTEEEALRSDRYRWKGAGSSSVKKKAAEETAVAAPAKRDDGKPRAAKSTQVEPAAKVARKSKAAIKRAPEFRDALAEAVQPAEVVVTALPSRQIAISLRLSPAERTLIQRRAAESGISASAYIRQCALEVEQLRSQVREALAAMERGERPGIYMADAAPAPAPGFFAWIARRCFPKRQPTLALRA